MPGIVVTNQVPVTLYDADGCLILVKDGAAMSDEENRAMLIAGHDHQNEQIRFTEMIHDPTDNVWRLAVVGKVQQVIPPPPPGIERVTVAADNPLSITGIHDTEYIITTGKTFYLQHIAVGAEGDPTEKGSKIEVYFKENSTEHIVERVYVTGFTQYGIYPDTSTARDSTTMLGDGTSKLIIRRSRMGASSAQEIDVVLRGYEL